MVVCTIRLPRVDTEAITGVVVIDEDAVAAADFKTVS